MLLSNHTFLSCLSVDVVPGIVKDLQKLVHEKNN